MIGKTKTLNEVENYAKYLYWLYKYSYGKSCNSIECQEEWACLTGPSGYMLSLQCCSGQNIEKCVRKQLWCWSWRIQDARASTHSANTHQQHFLTPPIQQSRHAEHPDPIPLFSERLSKSSYKRKDNPSTKSASNSDDDKKRNRLKQFSLTHHTQGNSEKQLRVGG